jgi:hypothetical protein
VGICYGNLRFRPSLPGDHPSFRAYMRDLNRAQQFAVPNRNEMMECAHRAQSRGVCGRRSSAATRDQRINCHDNFTQVIMFGLLSSTALNMVLVPILLERFGRPGASAHAPQLER